MGMKALPYVLSQYGWVAICGAITSFLVWYPPISRKHRPVLSGPMPPFQKSCPAVYLHMSDLHASVVRTGSYDRLLSLVQQATQFYSPNYTLFIGDLTDNRNDIQPSPYRGPMPEDWKKYNEMLQLAEIEDSVISVFGNHDLYRVGSLKHLNHLSNAKIEDERDFLLSVKYHFQEEIITKFILINPFAFPAPPICFGVDTFPSKTLYKRLEQELAINDSSITFILSHYPYLKFHPRSGLDKIFEHSTKQQIFLTGHWHKDHPYPYHIGDTIEIVGTGLFKSSVIGITIVDSGIVSYHRVSLSAPQRYFVTYPIDEEFLTAGSPFNETDSELRVLAYSNHLPNLTVHGAINGTLNCSLLEKKKYLCRTPFHLSPGHNQVTKEGDWFGVHNFFIGEKSDVFKEKDYLAEMTFGFYFLFILFFLLLLYIMALYLRNSARLQNWIDGIDLQHYWLSVTLFGFNAIKTRLTRLPQSYVFMLFLFLAWPLVMPTAFFVYHGKISWFCTWGYYISSFRFHFLPAEISFRYLWFVFLPMLLTASAITVPKNWGHLVDILVFLGLGYGHIELFNKITDMVGLLNALICPLVTLLPLAFYSSIIVFYIKAPKKSEAEDRLIDENSGWNSDFSDEQLIVP